MRRFPRRADISARSALTIHRGTANVSTRARPEPPVDGIAPTSAAVRPWTRPSALSADRRVRRATRQEDAVRYVDGPVVEGDLYIDADQLRVWELVRDVELPARFSPEPGIEATLDGIRGLAERGR